VGAGGDRQLARAGVWGGAKTGPSPVDRSRSGSKHHLIACGRGTPLAVSLTGGNRNDITQLIPLVDAIPPVRGRRGRPRRRPRKLYGDRAYHSRQGRRELRRRGIQARIARPKSPHGSGLGRRRWVVERTIAWLHQYRRLRVRYERRDDIHEAFLAIGCSLICLKLLQTEESFC
jgi:transposase